jgi:hypothetical protein
MQEWAWPCGHFTKRPRQPRVAPHRPLTDRPAVTPSPALSVVRHFLEDIARHGRYTGFCSLGVKFQPLESPWLRRHKGLPADKTGVLITMVHPLAPAAKVRPTAAIQLYDVSWCGTQRWSINSGQYRRAHHHGPPTRTRR